MVCVGSGIEVGFGGGVLGFWVGFWILGVGFDRVGFWRKDGIVIEEFYCIGVEVKV